VELHLKQVIGASQWTSSFFIYKLDADRLDTAAVNIAIRHQSPNHHIEKSVAAVTYLLVEYRFVSQHWR